MSRALTRVAGGLEAGVLGGLAMLALLAIVSLARGRHWWEAPNLLGSTFYGYRALGSGIGMATLSGSALHLVITGAIGCAFGLACGSIPGRRRLVLLGLATGIGWYYFADFILWPPINRLIPLYSFTPAFLTAHALFGVCLGYLARPRPNPYA